MRTNGKQLLSQILSVAKKNIKHNTTIKKENISNCLICRSKICPFKLQYPCSPLKNI